MSTYDVNDEGVSALNGMAGTAETAIAAIGQATQSMVNIAEEYADTIGPHQKELYEALLEIAQAVKSASEPAGGVALVLRRVASKYEEIISKQRFRGKSR